MYLNTLPVFTLRLFHFISFFHTWHMRYSFKIKRIHGLEWFLIYLTCKQGEGIHGLLTCFHILLSLVFCLSEHLLTSDNNLDLLWL